MRAVRRLASIETYISKDNPRAGAQVAAKIMEAGFRLGGFPMLGRSGRVMGTREFIVPDLPYILPYRIVGDEIQIDTVMHTSQRWPEKL